MSAILGSFRRLVYEIPWSASLCTTAFIEAEVVEASQTVGQALTKHYGCRPDWGAMNYLVHEEVEALPHRCRGGGGVRRSPFGSAPGARKEKGRCAAGSEVANEES